MVIGLKQSNMLVILFYLNQPKNMLHKYKETTKRKSHESFSQNGCLYLAIVGLALAGYIPSIYCVLLSIIINDKCWLRNENNNNKIQCINIYG